MYELLIRIETVCMGASLLTLLGVGVVATIVGLLLWLAGTYFSSVIIGILGASVGSFCGLLISQWLDVSSLLSMGVGATVLCIVAIGFRNIIIVILAIIIFALVGGTAYSSMILGSSTQQGESPSDPAIVRSFSHMDSGMRLSYVENISEKQDDSFEKLKVLLKDTLATMSPHIWKLLLFTLVGGIGGLLLVWFIKRFVVALCCSVVGALLVLVGVESLFMAIGFQMCNAFQRHRFILTVTYFSMVGIGAIVQLILTKSQKPKEAKIEKKSRS